MQTEDEIFEERLRSLQPKQPSDALKARLSYAMESDGFVASSPVSASTSKRGKVIWGTTFTALVSAMAAVWAVLLVLDHRSGPPRIAGETGGEVASSDASAGAVFEVAARPIERYATLVGAEPSPVFYLEDGSPVQRVSFRFLDTEVYEVDESGETVRVSSFRDEIRVIPVQSF